MFYKKLDTVDIKILNILQGDASTPIKEIAQQVELSISPCWNRIQKLQTAGYIKHKTAILDYEKMGYSNRTFIFIKTSQHKQKWSENFKNYILKQNQVIGLYRISGTYDYIIDVLSNNMKDFDKFYQNLINNVEVFEVTSSFVMETMKETTEIPILNNISQ
tara:strand:+ start:109 stop:591 length:483 start_codon:yes stop_codon:yes gene_type:complete